MGVHLLRGVGLGAFAGGADLGAGADLRGTFSRIEPEEYFVAHTAKVTDVHMNTPASTQVILARVVTAPRGPNAAWLTPPKAAVMSTFSPPWISTIAMSRMLTRICNAITAVTKSVSLPKTAACISFVASRNECTQAGVS